jgi:hypothetical protein
MKYIDAEKLIVEIESRMEDCKLPNGKFPTTTNAVRYEELSCLRNFITSLKQEQPEVVLTDNASFTKELKRFLSDAGNEKKRGGVLLPIIKHFYELGLNAKEEKHSGAV